MRGHPAPWIPALAVLALPLLGCADTLGARAGAPMEVSLTSAPTGGYTVVETADGPAISDAPAAPGYPLFASATISISRIYLIPAGEGGDEVDLMSADPPAVVDLMDLGPDAEAVSLSETTVPPGTYNQLRVVVQEAEVSLSDGLQFQDGTNAVTLKVPSGMESGIKVDLLGNVAADSGDLTSILLNLDLNENFKLQGNPETPAGLKGVIFTPHLREERRDAAPAAGSGI